MFRRNASIGNIKDMFHFANLAREDESEASKFCLKNKNFEQIFLYKDPDNIALYRGLFAGTGKACGIRRISYCGSQKLPIRFSIDKSNFIYDDCIESFVEEVTLTKGQLGLCEIHIESDAKFFAA